MPDNSLPRWLNQTNQNLLKALSRDDAAYKQLIQLIENIVDEQPSEIYQKILDEQTDLICRYLPDMRLIYANPAYVRFFKQDPAAILEKTLLDMIAPVDHPLIRSYVAQILSTHEPLTSQYLSERDGASYWYEWINAPIFDSDGKIIAIQGVGRDVTERKQIEDALRESEARFRQIAEHIEEVFYVFDPIENRVLYTSPAYERVWLRPVTALYDNARAFTDDVHPDDKPRLMKALARESATNEMLNERYRIVRPDGSIRHIWSRNFHISDENGQISRIVGIAADITLQIASQENEVNLAIEQERTRLLSNFIRDASHEFKTPLSIMSTSIYLAEHTPSEGQRQHHHRKIKDQVQRLTRLIEALITMSRLDNDTMFQYRALDINRVLAQMLRYMEADLKEYQVQSELEVDRSLPRILLDEREIFLAFQHILGNALRFSPSGGTILIQTKRYEDYCRIAITDEGPGIDEEHLPRIFDRFYRVDQARSTEGFGLGLSIARRIVELHGGKIHVESWPGKGSCFTIELPLVTAKLDSDVSSTLS